MSFPQEFDMEVTPEDYSEGLHNFLGGEYAKIVMTKFCVVAVAGKRLGHPSPRATTICYQPEVEPTPYFSYLFYAEGYAKLIDKFDDAISALWKLIREGRLSDPEVWIARRTRMDMPQTVVLHMTRKEIDE